MTCFCTVGKGFVKAHGRDDDKEDYYVVSAFHQFHCIVRNAGPL